MRGAKCRIVGAGMTAPDTQIFARREPSQCLTDGAGRGVFKPLKGIFFPFERDLRPFMTWRVVFYALFVFNIIDRFIIENNACVLDENMLRLFMRHKMLITVQAWHKIKSEGIIGKMHSLIIPISFLCGLLTFCVAANGMLLQCVSFVGAHFLMRKNLFYGGYLYEKSVEKACLRLAGNLPAAHRRAVGGIYHDRS